MTSRSRALESEEDDVILATLNVQNGIPTSHPRSRSLEGLSDHLDELESHQWGTGAPYISAKKDLTSGIMTTFATDIYEGDDGYGMTTIRQSSVQNLQWDYGFERSSIEECTDGSLRHRFQIPVYGDQVGDTIGAEADRSADIVFDDEVPRPSRSTTVTARRVRHSRLGRRAKEMMPKLSEDALMKRYLQECLSLMSHLKESLESQPYARLSHIFHDGRTFGFASALMKSGERMFGIVAVIWQTRTKPRRAVCVSFYNHGRSRTLTAICTCCSLRRQTKHDEILCSHAKMCFETDDLVSSVEKILNTRREEEGDRTIEFPYFGEHSKVDDSNAPHTVKLALKRTRQSHAYARRWRFEIVFDVEQRIFLPVLKVQTRATRCLLCRGNPERRMSCVHEEACRGAKNRSEVDPQQENGDQNISDESDWDSDNPTPIESTTNTSIRIDPDESTEYSPLSYKRSLLPCKGQVRDMETLVDQIDSVNNLIFHERNLIDCEICGAKNSAEPVERYRRQPRLFTLTQGTVDISVYDWHCSTCQKEKRYTGTTDGIYPAGKTYCCSTELMYFWLNQVCLQGLSFRAAYKTSNLLSNSPGLRHRNARIRSSGSNSLEPDKHRSRRRASTAFYNFLRTINTNNDAVTSKLFSCPTCEVPLSSIDCKELGIAETERADLKRMKAIVIDGTAAGILNRLPDMDRTLLDIRSINDNTGRRRLRSPQRLVKKPRYRKLTEKLIDKTRDVLREVLKRRRSRQSSMVGAIRFWLTSDCGDVLGVQSAKTKFTKSESRMLQLLCSEDSCICPEGPVSNIPTQNHCEECLELRTKFLESYS